MGHRHECCRGCGNERAARTPLGRLGTVQDIAKGICFLASDQASFMSAQALVVDGGVTLARS